MFVSWAEKKPQLLNPDVADHALWNSVLCERSDLQKQGHWPVTAKSAFLACEGQRCRCAHKDTSFTNVSSALGDCIAI